MFAKNRIGTAMSEAKAQGAARFRVRTCPHRQPATQGERSGPRHRRQAGRRRAGSCDQSQWHSADVVAVTRRSRRGSDDDGTWTRAG